MVHQINRKTYVEALTCLDNVPEHLLKKWWNEGHILDNNGVPCWPAGRPRSMPIEVLYRLHKELVFYTIEPVGLYNPENLGKIDPHEKSREH